MYKLNAVMCRRLRLSRALRAAWTQTGACLHLTRYKVHPACSFDMGTEPSLVSTRDVILRFFSQYLDAKWAFKHGEFTLNWDSWS